MQNPIDSLFYLEFAGKNCYSADSPLAALLITASEPYTISGEKLEQVYRGLPGRPRSAIFRIDRANGPSPLKLKINTVTR